jgi:uncharacterized protein YggU (UPF0235/DUF167 family)
MGEGPWITTAEGVVLTVRVTPKGGRDAVEGMGRLADGRTVLKIRVRAAPSAGEANAGLRQLLADRLGVAASCIDVVAGTSARIKRVRIVGDATVLAAACARLWPAAPPPQP